MGGIGGEATLALYQLRRASEEIVERRYQRLYLTRQMRNRQRGRVIRRTLLQPVRQLRTVLMSALKRLVPNSFPRAWP